MAAYQNVNDTSNSNAMETDLMNWRDLEEKRKRDEKESAMDIDRTDEEELVDMMNAMKISDDGSHSTIMAKKNDRAPGDSGGTAVACPREMGENFVIPQEEVVYIIASHGHYSQDKKFWNHIHKIMKVPTYNIIKDYRYNFENINFGVLVNTNVLLNASEDELRQDAVNRHISGIIDGKIKVFRRYAWSEPSDLQEEEALANFPNLIFSEGNSEHNPFKARIARYFNGRIDYFELYKSVQSGRLISLNPSENLGEDNHSLLSHLLPIFDNDVSEIARSQVVKKYNIIFATCMGGLPPAMHEAWTGKDRERPHVAGGGKLKKYNKRKRQYKKKKKTTQKRKTRKHKKKYKKKTKRKTNKKKTKRKRFTKK